jgi:hypothetical protein
VLIAFYRAGREAEVVGIGGAAAVNGILNGAIIRVMDREEMRLSKGGGNEGLTSWVHSMAREEGGTAAGEEEATLGRRRWKRKREAGGARWAKKAEWVG